MKRAIRIDARDNVAIALTRLAPGERVAVDGLAVVLTEEIPPGHKFALCDLPAGSRAIKYGHPIGRFIRGVRAGEWVHTHNLCSELAGPRSYAYRPLKWGGGLPQSPPPTFRGYRRRDGKVGIRNEIWILATVACINKECERLARLAAEGLPPTVDGVYAFGHPYGCSQVGEDLERTRSLLAGLARHPNAGGVLLVGLGCEENRLADLAAALGDYDRERVKFLLLQETEDETAEALRLLETLIRRAQEDRREEVSAAELVVGLKCGGSDGFSGLTANPLAGLDALYQFLQKHSIQRPNRLTSRDSLS
ncbi:MAG: UxaA family hydrolase [Bacillota bacterium]